MSQRERPILFSGPLVRAILDGTKTVTRRPITPPKGLAIPSRLGTEERSGACCAMWPDLDADGNGGSNGYVPVRCPFGMPGDHLYVRETFHAETGHAPDDYPAIHYAADMEERQHDGHSISPPNERRSTHAGPWTPSIHMPRWASRILLEVTDVRVERLQDITEDDARAEGLQADDISRVGVPCFSARQNFAATWSAIYGAGSWDASPWVWRIAFKRTGGL